MHDEARASNRGARFVILPSPVTELRDGRVTRDGALLFLVPRVPAASA